MEVDDRKYNKNQGAKLIGRKIENQVSIRFGDSYPIERIYIESKKQSYHTCNLNRGNSLKSLIKNSKKRVKEKTMSLSKIKKQISLLTPRIKLRQRKKSMTDFNDNKSKEVTRISERSIEIPHSVNRFQGKYEEIVPLKYKQMKMILRKEKREKEFKKEETKKRAARIRLQNDKIRKANRIHTQRSSFEYDAMEQEQKESKNKEKRRIKEMGLEFLVHLKTRGNCLSKLRLIKKT